MEQPKSSPKRRKSSKLSSSAATPVAIPPDFPLDPELVPPERLADLEVPPPAASVDERIGERDAIDLFLLERGFTPVSKIVLRDSTGHDGVKFIKAYDLQGNTLYIDIDSDENIHVSPTDLTVTQVKSAEKIPISTKLTALECAKLEVCGVGFECDNGICTLIRDGDNMEPQEMNFSVTRAPQTRWGYESGAPVSYPIVRLSEITKNPLLVMKNVEKASLRMAFEAHKTYHSEIMGLTTDWIALKSVMEIMPLGMRAAFKSVLKSMIQLKNHRDNTVRCPANKAKLDLIVWNIHLRQNYLNELLVLTRKMKLFRDQMTRMASELNLQFDEMKARYDEKAMDILKKL